MFRSFILKLTGYCNLNCSYCYMVNSVDQTFTRKPRILPVDVSQHALRAISEHARTHGLQSVEIALHGGEPSLWPLENFREFFAGVEALRSSGLDVSLSMQTNLLQKLRVDLLELLVQHKVGLGVSIDGPREINDAERYDFAGNGSYDRIMRNIAGLHELGLGNIIGGFLCVMQTRLPPEQFLIWVSGLPVTRIELIWPLEFNQQSPPWAGGSVKDYATKPRYGDWLVELFDAWLALDRPEVEIRFFNELMEMVLGGAPQTDQVGPWSLHSLVINTDGGIELTDYLRTSHDGATVTGFNVTHDRLDDILKWPPYLMQRDAAELQPSGCTRCPHWTFCRGGTLSGRLNSEGVVTPNPSVLCFDHRHFYDHVAQRLLEARLTRGEYHVLA